MAPVDPDAPAPPRRDHWFEGLADHLGEAYLRYSFTRGTEQEVAFLIEALGLDGTTRVLDVGCGPGRHAHALGRRGVPVHGVDVSRRFIDIAQREAPTGVTFERADARYMAFDRAFDVVISLCQGAFGLSAGGPDDDGADLDPDLEVLGAMIGALRPGGLLALTAFSAYHAVRYQTDAGFDAARGVAHEHTTIRDPAGVEAPTELWTTCYTPRELRLLCHSLGLDVDAVWSVEPGDYRRRTPEVEAPELLVVARRPPVR